MIVHEYDTESGGVHFGLIPETPEDVSYLTNLDDQGRLDTYAAFSELDVRRELVDADGRQWLAFQLVDQKRTPVVEDGVAEINFTTNGRSLVCTKSERSLPDMSDEELLALLAARLAAEPRAIEKQYAIVVAWSQDDEEWVATAPDLGPSVAGRGNSPENAVGAFRAELEIAISG